MVVQEAIVRHMAICHDKAVVAYNGFAFRGCAAVDSGELTDSGVIADDSICLFAFELEVLWIATNDCARIDMAVFADTCTAVDGDIIVNHGAFANLYILVDAREVSNRYRRVKLCFRMNVVHIF